MRIGLFEYGAGNMHSLANALASAGADVALERNPTAVLDSDALVLPGVGAFPEAASRLKPAAHAIRVALQAGFPCLGISLGMQLLFERSEEGEGIGLGVIPGAVRRLQARRVPHMGWNQVEVTGDPLFAQVGTPVAYFAHSYACEPGDAGEAIAWAEHEGDRFVAAVRHGSSWGVQFRPEKSGELGLRLIRNFMDAAARARGIVTARPLMR